MGHVYTTIRISNIERTRITEVEALVDTGATLTVLPQKVAQELELGEPSGLSLRGILSISEGSVPKQSESGTGEGAVTLETLALSLDPLTGKLKEKRLLLYPLALERSTSGKSFVKLS